MSKRSKHFYEFGPYRLDCDERLLRRASEVVSLTPKAFDLLLALVQDADRLITKEELLEKVWAGSFVEEANLSHNIYKLREALGEKQKSEKYIETVPRRGYRFVAKVTEVRDEASEQILTSEVARAHVLIEETEADGSLFRTSELPGSSRRIATLTTKRLVVVAIACVAGITALGAYLFVRARTRPTGAPVLKSMAVLPFRPLSSAARDETLELGIADTLITRLSTLPQLSVRPINAVRKFNDTQPDAVTAGKELTVDSVLDGSIQRSGGDLRVTVRLTRVADGAVLWADKFDGQFANIFGIQDQISERVAGILSQQISETERERLVKRDTTDSLAYELYLRGRYFLNQTNDENLRKALNYFQQAIERDPQYAHAYTGEADVYNQLGLWNFLPETEAFPKAKTACQKALSLDESQPEAHAALAYVTFRYEWDYATAEKEYQRALTLSPNNATVHYLYGEYLTVRQRFDEAAVEQQRAFELDPLFLPNRMMIAVRLYFMRQYDQAIAQLKQIVEIDPQFVVADDLLWASYRERGSYDESVAARLQSLKLQGYSPTELETLHQAYAKSGIQGFWRQDNEQIEQRLQKHTSPLIFLAMNNAQLKNKDAAFMWLERALAARSGWVPELKVDPVWDNLRDDARFVALMRRANLA
jgi:DNA-binding winged helix-turn-helix (wHTH) protein/TolB-like protein/Flp pilus assembly protein TadD